VGAPGAQGELIWPCALATCLEAGQRDSGLPAADRCRRPVTVTDPEMWRYFMTIRRRYSLCSRPQYGRVAEVFELDMDNRSGYWIWPMT